MPYKFNESRREKIKKSRYRVTNWQDYNNALRRRGGITIWFTEEAIVAWHPAKTGHEDGRRNIRIWRLKRPLFIREAFHLPLRALQKIEYFSGSQSGPYSTCNRGD